MNLKGVIVLIFWIPFWECASSCYPHSSKQYKPMQVFLYDCNGYKLNIQNGETLVQREKSTFKYKINLEKNIKRATCENEVTKASLNLRKPDDVKFVHDLFTFQSTLVVSKEAEGQWNCDVRIDNCTVNYFFRVKVLYNHIAVTIEDSYNSTIQNKGSEVIITARGDSFWIWFRSDFDIVSSSCHDVNGYGSLGLSYINFSRKSGKVYIQEADKVKGPWNCSFKDDLGVKKFVIVKVIWKPSTLSTLSTTPKTTTETPIGLIGAVVATLVICVILVTVCLVLYRRKAEIPTTPPQPDAPTQTEARVYYTIDGDDYDEENNPYSYAYAYAKPETFRTNVACNALYDTVSDK